MVLAEGYLAKKNLAPESIKDGDDWNLFEIKFSSELKDGEMKELIVGPGIMDKVLITKYKG